MNNQGWALIGKIGTVVAILVGVATLFFNIYDRSRGPNIDGFVRYSEYPLSPSLADKFKPSPSLQTVSNILCQSVAKGNSITNALSDIQILWSSDLASLNIKLYEMNNMLLVHATIINNGSDIARDVRLAYTGSGMAQIVRGPGLKDDAFQWTNSVPIGDIIPQGQADVLIWPMGISSIITPQGEGLTIVYSTGIGKIYPIREFWGRFAEWSFRFDRQSLVSKIIDYLAVLFVLFFLVRMAVKKGFVSFNFPHKRRTNQKPEI